jgi:hypothetical protein
VCILRAYRIVLLRDTVNQYLENLNKRGKIRTKYTEKRTQLKNVKG